MWLRKSGNYEANFDYKTLGTFKTLEAAVAVRKQAEQEWWDRQNMQSANRETRSES